MDQNQIKIYVREERPEDYRRAEEITKAAFSYPGRIEQGGIGCPYEHWMVHELRKRDGIQPLSLVAEMEEVMVGHIICSHAAVKTKEKSIPVLNFGPLSVLPEYQRKGVGGALLKTMMERAKNWDLVQFCSSGGPSITRSLDLWKQQSLESRTAMEPIIRRLWQWSCRRATCRRREVVNITSQTFTTMKKTVKQ